MGNVSGVINYVKTQYTMYKLTTLLCDAVDKVVNVPEFKIQKDCVRQQTDDWYSKVHAVSDKYVDVEYILVNDLNKLTSYDNDFYIKSILANVLKCFPLNNDEFHYGHVAAFCTYSIDLCAAMLNREQYVDVENVMYDIVTSLLCKNPDACFEFLKYVSS